MFLMGDPHRLRQVFLNLLSNAIKFTEKGSIHVAVTGRTAPDGRFALRVEVKDSGVGIPEEAKEKLFRPFVQADSSTTRQYGGTGLGLAICKRLIELMGGEIGFTSSPGKGSTFHFSVPLTVAVVGSERVTHILETSVR